MHYSWAFESKLFSEDLPDTDHDFAGNVAVLGFSQTLLIYETKWVKVIQIQVVQTLFALIYRAKKPLFF